MICKKNQSKAKGGKGLIKLAVGGGGVCFCNHKLAV